MSGLIKKNQNWLPSVFNDFFDNDWPVATLPARTASPAINVCETDKEYVVEVAAPGMTKEDFRVCIDDNDYLVLSLESATSVKATRKRVATCAANSPTPLSVRLLCSPIMWIKRRSRPIWTKAYSA